PQPATGDEAGAGSPRNTARSGDGDRLGLLGAALANLARGHPEAVDCGPAERATTGQISSGADDTGIERRTETRRELGTDERRLLGNVMPDRAPQCERHQRQPVQRHGPCRGIDHAAVQLRRAHEAEPPTLRHRPASERLWPTRARYA